jgi:glucosamine kinase
MNDIANRSLGLGIDAGGTQTRWALADTTGEIAAYGSVGGLSALQMNTDEGRQRICDTLSELARDVLATGRPLGVYAGLTGFSEGGDAVRALIAESLGLMVSEVALGSDIEIAYRDLFKPGEGYVVYAGTGSIAAFIDERGQLHRAGGHGVILDDAGGGFWIACQALRYIWRAEDERPGSWDQSPMAIAVFKRIGGSDWPRSREFIYGSNSAETRGEIGKLALAVAEVADVDPVAAEILSEAGRELARLARAMLSRFGSRPVALSGRVVELHPLIEKSMRLALPLSTQLQVRASEAHIAAARVAAKQIRMVK